MNEIKKITIRASAEDYDKIKKIMKERKYSTINRFVLETILNPTATIGKVDHEDMEKIYYEINRIGNNINQIAKIANTNGIVTGEMLKEVNDNFDDCIDVIMKTIKMLQEMKKKEAKALSEIWEKVKDF